MKIDIIRIDPEVKRKIYEKYYVSAIEIKNVLRENEPIFRKVGGSQVRAIGLYNRYITIYFEYNKITKQANIKTAYPSSKIDVKHYKKIRKK